MEKSSMAKWALGLGSLAIAASNPKSRWLIWLPAMQAVSAAVQADSRRRKLKKGKPATGKKE